MVLSRSEFFDLRSLFGFRDSLNRVGVGTAPSAALVSGPGAVRAGRVGILPGSFNPPTSAHVELARAARQRFRLDCVVFSLSSVIVDKERAGGLCEEDRLLLLDLIAQGRDGLGSAVTNRGLYSDQVLGFRALLGRKTSIYFIVGMDKVLQIFDAKYYDDRGAALQTLFFDAHLIAANRAGWGQDDLRQLLEKKENQPYEGRVYPLALPPSLKDLSSTEIRDAAARAALDPDAVPDVVAEFIATTSAFRPGYDLRAAALHALYPLRNWAQDEVDLERTVACAIENTANGRSLREALSKEPPAADELKALLVRLDLCRNAQ